MWFVKSRRAQNDNDYETWIANGLCTTLNAFDNGGESRATVLVLQSTQPNAAINDDLSPTLVQAMGEGGSHVPILIIDGTRMDDVRVTDSQIMTTMCARWGTGGGNVPYVFPIQDGREMEKQQNGLGVGDNQAPAYTLDSTGAQSVAINLSHTQELNSQTNENNLSTIQTVVRRLTPIECERLQGFPDDWTEGQADSHRYKQMGNAVTVNVIEAIGKNL